MRNIIILLAMIFSEIYITICEDKPMVHYSSDEFFLHGICDTSFMRSVPSNILTLDSIQGKSIGQIIGSANNHYKLRNELIMATFVGKSSKITSILYSFKYNDNNNFMIMICLDTLHYLESIPRYNNDKDCEKYNETINKIIFTKEMHLYQGLSPIRLPVPVPDAEPKHKEERRRGK